MRPGQKFVVQYYNVVHNALFNICEFKQALCSISPSISNTLCTIFYIFFNVNIVVQYYKKGSSIL